MPHSYDVIIAGLGAMRSATAFHLARRGVKVLGLDRYSPPHDRGSSHGQTRIIREAPFEGSPYVEMIQRAYKLWDELERASQITLHRETGGLMIGLPESKMVTGATESTKTIGLNPEILTASEIISRFPCLLTTLERRYTWPRDFSGIVEVWDSLLRR
jgi:sarcosine oxidase